MSEGKNQPEMKHALIERLMHYYQFVNDRLDTAGSTVTSGEIAELVQMDDTLVRKDLAALGVRGQPRVGFNVADVLAAIREVLGFDEALRAVLVGVGQLGGAIASYPGFARYGLDICGIFDSDPDKIGQLRGRQVILPMGRLPIVVRGRGVSTAILTVPSEATQEAADQVIRAGVKAIWNFGNMKLKAPEDVYVRHEHISTGLADLSYHLKQMKPDWHS
jgi:redox-sensing transcriptional repressor